MTALDKNLTVALVEDHQLLAASLASALAGEGCTVVRPALTSMPELTAELVDARPDVALVDLDLHGVGDGTDLVGPLTRIGTSVLVVSGTTDESKIGRCLSLGAAGWVPKSAALDRLLAAIDDAGARRSVLPAQERERLVALWRSHAARTAANMEPFERLTRREAAVLRALVGGRSVERIAAGAFVSEATVRSQVRAILTKLHVNSQLEAVALATRVGWAADGG